MRREIVSAGLAALLLTLLLGIGYPLVITGVSQIAFPGNANGQQVFVRGRLVGSKIIGQAFPGLRYFHSRPSATVPADNAAATTFSNLGPNSIATEQALAASLKAYLALERPYDPGLSAARVPVDAVATSASGIDPDISPANASIQAHRVAAVRHLPLARVSGLIARYTHGRGLGFSGEPGVNVLELNLALDRLGAR